MKKLHAHEVLDMMGTKTYTEELLKKEILEKFGEDTLFYTCSAEDMNADELHAFQHGMQPLYFYSPNFPGLLLSLVIDADALQIPVVELAYTFVNFNRMMPSQLM